MLLKYLSAAHIPPTLLVATLAFLFSKTLFDLSDSLLIGLTIFSGQLIVGWTNDLIDVQSDHVQGRRSPWPLVNCVNHTCSWRPISI